MSPREAFLHRVKQAVADGNRAAAVPRQPEHSGVGYQGAGPDPMQRFCQELAAAGGKGYVAAHREAAVHTIQSILQAHNARKIFLSRGGLIDRLELTGKLKDLGLEVKTLDDVPSNSREDFFNAEVGITNVHRLIAETGTVVMASKADEPRFASLLPPVHIALADRSQLLPDLFDLFDLFSPATTLSKTTPASCLTLITGPSKTGDIELKLVTGVHGPGEIHVILCAG
jgi:L-lactate dehydrogenase complex protein LldG